MNIEIIEASQKKEKPDWSSDLGFGKIFTDHMFTMDWTAEQGWCNAKIEPYAPICMDPASLVLHYAQETFEGLKAYKTKDGRVLLFRPEMNARRFANSNRRLCMPEMDEEMFVEAVAAVVNYEKDWIPTAEGTSLYIRPFMFATEAAVGVHPSNAYKFMILLSPVGAYYPEGVNPVKIYVEDEYVRATKGGTGFTKCGGNYAASIAERKYVEEVGTMNVMFKIDNKIVTAPCDGTVLPGVTRDSILQLLTSWGYEVEERHLAIDELMQAGKEGRLEEAFGTGTAAVISPVGELNFKGEITVINDFKTGELTQKLYDTLTGIQWGDVADTYGWTREVK